MNTELYVYLSSLQNKIFKLLPMREAYDYMHEDNHVYDYAKNLGMNCVGALAVHTKLKREATYLEVLNDILIMGRENMEFEMWRSKVLRSTRKIGELRKKYAPTENE